ncbi:hypothetical protein ESY86_11845 [Subsaximicrobium wynnwilliamsii]|uniref:Uncharacterized protein n=1 Tax=Subsaximicrobium wynnwilliamsii TaxID=291179 RepID=A0A5C6ZF78_9FLAO|nr:hypothetical protein [Subsaximicrobium wynnwilliamsii]TXD82931.1 hypothetical protein ESY87_11880 [Subsaximicrobium wynnwilliamsii]TXD88652.1 hypothetical protein ESY86_11845 [Subsaximicrobium wynnwilliamsii]TXE02745.1 hypothetical protein ESY88_10900 [Subsaximicrobium wynnwilliamsii]
MYYIIGFLATVMLIRFITNFYKYKRIQKLFKKYQEYLQTNALEFAQYKQEIISLLKDAGLKDFSIIHQESLGYGNFANMQVSGFDNLTNRRVDIVGSIRMRFNEAIGVFRKRFKESFNPIFWIDFIVKFPQYLMEFFGVLPEKVAVRIFLVIYWLLAILFGLKKFEILDYLMK